MLLGAGIGFGVLAVVPEAPAGTCLAPAAWTALDGEKPRPANAAEVIATAAGRDVVLLGEQHDDADHHRWQLQTLAALHARRPAMVIGFEMFPRRLQPLLDRWVAGELGAREFLRQADWEKVWKLPPDLYLPLFEFARLNRIPMLALNVEAALTEAVAEKGWEGVPVERREGVGRAAPATEAYRDFLFEVYREHGARRGGEGKEGQGGKVAVPPARSDPAFRRFIESQQTWDRAMAEVLARPLAGSGPRPLVVGIMGAGHVRGGYGVAHQLRDLGVRSVGSLLPVPAATDCRMIKAGLADAVFAVPTPPPFVHEPPRLGVALEAAEGGVRIADVVAGSLAERSGLARGDLLLAAAGSPLKRIPAFIEAVRLQPPGSWLPLQVKRGDATLEIVVKFPPKP
ncbi:MAG: ChaN family lipoprotein [Rhodocyclaceae bacterium]|nr:ChaN family lipoprotein [Rhodocyclaceae bacterium]